jgi:hypothetical protein
MKIKFKTWVCAPSWAQYSNGRPALVLVDADGQRVAVATVNMPEVPLEEGEVLIKGYAENAGMTDALVEAGIIEPPHRAVPAGWVSADVARLKVKPE